MPLADILQAIAREADDQVRQLAADSKERMAAMNDRHEQALAGLRRTVLQDKEQRKHQMRSRAEGMARMLSNHAVLRHKQEQLDVLYEGVIEGLAALPQEKIEALLSTLLASIDTEGTILPAKPHLAMLKKMVKSPLTLGDPIDARGGFRFVSARQDRDCTFEFLVNGLLRPETEIEAATKLFGTR